MKSFVIIQTYSLVQLLTFLKLTNYLHILSRLCLTVSDENNITAWYIFITPRALFPGLRVGNSLPTLDGSTSSDVGKEIRSLFYLGPGITHKHGEGPCLVRRQFIQYYHFLSVPLWPTALTLKVKRKAISNQSQRPSWLSLSNGS